MFTHLLFDKQIGSDEQWNTSEVKNNNCVEFRVSKMIETIFE
jgi:hypothetical protein